MKLAVLKMTMDSLYQKYLIPMVLFDQQQQPLYPPIRWQATPVNQNFFKVAPQTELHLFSREHFFYGTFAFSCENQRLTLLLGPCGIIGEAGETFTYQGHQYLDGVHYTKEDAHSFKAFAKLLFQLTTDELLSEDRIHWHYAAHETPQNFAEKNIEANLYQRRLQEATLDSYQFELRYTEYIKRNQPEKIAWLFKKMSQTYRVQLAPNQLEGLKLKFSAFIAIITRLSIDEGVPIDQAFGLSDAMIQGLGRIHSANEWLIYMKDATYRFMDLLHNHPHAEKSAIVKMSINYIDTHIYEKITISDLADSVDRNGTYIAALFKKETNQTISQFIHERKVNEAKHLLLFTDKSYKEISALLSFASQSHFIAVFKKITGLTPRTYKEKHFAYSIY